MNRVFTLTRHFIVDQQQTVGTNTTAATTATAATKHTTLIDVQALTAALQPKEMQAHLKLCYEELKKPIYHSDLHVDTLTSQQHAVTMYKSFLSTQLCTSAMLRQKQYMQFLAALGASGARDFGIAAKLAISLELFGLSVHELGTARHHSWLAQLDQGKIIGCFGMTEIEHGSNVRAVGTTATYDVEKQEFVIHTPHDGARKFWIGNSRLGGNNICVVFARLIVQGKDHGVHGFIVPLTNQDGQAMAGVDLRNTGEKIGWRSVDNSCIRFHQVRIPRENMLNKHGDVSADGKYTTPIANEDQRFAAVLAALVFGRLIYCAGPVSTLFLALTIAIRYAHSRKQFGSSISKENSIISYPSHQQKLMPILANTYCFQFGVNKLIRIFSDDGATPEFHALVSGFKAYISDYCTIQLGVLRIACGGHGYSALNRIGSYRAEYDNFSTAEGDSTILKQQAARYLLKEYRKKYAAQGVLKGTLTLISEEVDLLLTSRAPTNIARTEKSHLLSLDFHKKAFAFRLARLLHAAASKLMAEIKKPAGKGVDTAEAQFKAWNSTVPLLTEAVDAYIHVFVLDQVQKEIHHGDPRNRAVLTQLAALYALSTISQFSGFYLENTFMLPRKAAAIRELVSDLCAQTSSISLNLVDAYELPDHMVNAPIGLKDKPNYVANIVDATPAWPEKC